MDYKQAALTMIERGEAGDYAALRDAFDMVRCLELDGSMEVDGQLIYNKARFDEAHQIVKTIRTLSAKAVVHGGGAGMLDLNKRTLLFDAPWASTAARASLLSSPTIIMIPSATSAWRKRPPATV